MILQERKDRINFSKDSKDIQMIIKLSNEPQLDTSTKHALCPYCINWDSTLDVNLIFHPQLGYVQVCMLWENLLNDGKIQQKNKKEKTNVSFNFRFFASITL